MSREDAKDRIAGSMIISEFMGCSRSLGGVFRVNPWKLDEVSHAIHTALVMTNEEKTLSHHRRYRHVMSYTFKHWAESYLKELEKASQTEDQKRVVQLGWGSKLHFIFLPNHFVDLKGSQRLVTSSYASAKKRILLFDYGGTLADVDEQNPTNFLNLRSTRELAKISKALQKPNDAVIEYLRLFVFIF